MGAGHALLAVGIGVGITITEVVRRRLDSAGKRHGSASDSGPRRAVAEQSASTGQSSSEGWRFSAQDYYDR